MHKELLIQAFEKVRGDLLKETGVAPSDTKCAKELSSIVSESFPYGERRLKDFYNEAKAKIKGDITIPQTLVLQALAKYLGYVDYVDFVNKHTSQVNSLEEAKAQKPKKDKQFKKRYKVLITLTLIAVLGYLGYIYFNRQCWMVWKGDHYEEVIFNAEKLKEGSLKLCKENRIKNFKQIAPSCNTQFFNNDGSVRIWYGKNIHKQLEYFTDLGLHPETGKTLKPITQYMIDKYICP